MKTLAALNEALTAAPLDAALHREMAQAQYQQGDMYAAQIHAIAAGSLERYAAESPARQAQELCTIATAYFTNSDYKIAATLYRLVLAIAPDMAVPYMNLAAMCAAAGYPDEADACRQAAYRIQRVFIEHDGEGARRVLILNAGRNSGNIPIEVMMPTARWSRIKYIIDYAAEDEDAQLRPYELVFNAIGEPDVATSLTRRLEQFAAGCGRPVLNAPAMIPRTQRHRMPALLAGLDDVYAAPCVRLDAAGDASQLAGVVAGGGLAFPLLVRAAASHGGDSLQRCADIAGLQHQLQGKAGAHYLSGYHDYRSADGHYRKYRFIFIDRQPYPYHLAISPNWMVHYFSADMKAAPWKTEEERRFLDDPAAVLGARAMAAIAAVAQRVDLDYAGIDCTLLADGRVFVFEANASMLVHHEPVDSVFAYKNVHVQRIVDAFQQMLERRLA